MVNDLFYDVFGHVTDLIAHVPELSMNNFDAFCFFSFVFFNLDGGCNINKETNKIKSQIWLKTSEVLKAR